MPLAAAITGGFGLLNGAVSAIGQKYSADRYLEGVQQTNEQNYKIWQEQQQHNLDMFNVQNDANVRNWQNQFDQTNAYNTALAQRQRLEEAGLNPAQMMQGGNAGVASSSGIPTATAQPANAPQMQAPGFVESPLVAFAQTAIQSLSGISQALNLNSQTATENALREPRVSNMEADTHKKVAEKHLVGAQTLTEQMRRWHTSLLADNQYLQNKFDRETLETRVAIQEEMHKLTIAQRIGQNLSNEQQQIINEWLPVEKQANVAYVSYMAYEAYCRGELTLEQVKTEVKKQILFSAQTATEGEKQKTEQKKRSVMDSEINENIADAYKATEEGKTQEYVRKNLGATTNKTDEETRGLKISNDNAEKVADAYVRATISEYGFKEIQNNSKSYMLGDGKGNGNAIYNTITGIDALISPLKGIIGGNGNK